MSFRSQYAALGLIVGASARLAFPGHHWQGVVTSAVLGSAGALLAASTGQRLGLYSRRHRAAFAMSALGAIAFVLFYFGLAHP